MLVGRDRESRELERATASAATGTSATLVVVGAPGVGKTALLQGLAARVRSSGSWQVLEARGHEQEGGLPYAGLHSVLADSDTDLDCLPDHLRGPLLCALGRAPGPSPPPFMVAAATLQVIALAAARAPLLLLLDDLHWLDAASAKALLFTVRRLRSEPVVTLAGLRLGSSLTASLRDLPTLPLEDLADDAAQELLLAAEPSLSADVAAALVRRTGGNPLALLQSVHSLSPGQRNGTSALNGLRTGETRAAVARTVARVQASGRRLALLVALEPGLPLETATTAASALGLGPDAVEAALAGGLVVEEAGTLALKHPLVGSVLVDASTPRARREAHLALAGAIRAAGSADVWRPAWHAGRAATRASEPHAAELEGLAGIARARGDLSTAARVFEQSASTTPDSEVRARRLLEAGECAVAAGLPTARILLEGGRECSKNPLLRARADRTLGRVAAWHGDAATATAVAIRYDERLDRLGAANLHAMAAHAAFIARRPGDFLAHTQRAVELAADVPPEERVFVDLSLAQALTYEGRPDGDLALSLASRFLSAPDPDLACPLVEALMHSDEWAMARTVVDTMLPVARLRSQVPALTWLQVVNAEIALHDGDLDAATDASVEALTMANAIGLDIAEVQAEAGLALVEAAAGRGPSCEARVRRVHESCAAHGFGAPLLYVDLAAARLALSRNDEAAVALFEKALQRTDEWGSRGVVVWTALPELVEAQVRARDLDGARASSARLESTPGVADTRSGRAWLAHARLCVAEDAGLDSAYEQALRYVEEAACPMLSARTRLMWAERVRRLRRRTEAALAAQEALELFDSMGAQRWRERAASELVALGRQSAPGVSRLLRALTPQERQIAQIAATGVPTREIAASLFLSPKTVEHHLTRVYRVLGVRSKSELAARIAADRVSDPRPSA